MIRNKTFDFVKKLVPRISDTELIALKSGTTSIDRKIFEGSVDDKEMNKLSEIYKNKTHKFDESKIDSLIKLYGNEEKIYPNDKYKEIIDYIGKNKFFSFIINEKYEGTNLPVHELSSVLTKIASINPALGVTIMVPNSLGPGELLINYGTEEQKEKYLPGLANGKYVPCFGLTGPHNGSDATGSIDEGTVIFDNNKLYIDLQINKRYITLAPVSNLIGLAFKLKDPYDLLDKGKEGVTVALIENTLEGLEQLTHHNPLNAGFPNGTLKGRIKIPMENVIGGEKNCGEGWKMLMECLAAGRGICLPATANASSKASMFGIYHYALHRKQFKIPLVKMEGVQEKLVNMLFNTWIIQSGVDFTNSILDSGEKPAVISAIMKQQTTDRARDVLNDAMDIHAGSSICLGENNFLEKFYRSAPIGITVEGSNVLTRNLIIFGQGLNKSHPHIYDILDSILKDDKIKFEDNFKLMLSHVVYLYLKSITQKFAYETKLEKQTYDFANLVNFVALKGGALKSEQLLSSDMADVFSNIYFSYAIKFAHDNDKISEKLTNYCLDRLYNENQAIINKIIDNFSGKFLFAKILLYPLKGKAKSMSYLKTKEIIQELESNRKILEKLKENIYTKGTILEELEKLTEYRDDANSKEKYDLLYDKVIQVGEFQNTELEQYERWEKYEMHQKGDILEKIRVIN
jgi:acyl-CoA dehydrogenase